MKLALVRLFANMLLTCVNMIVFLLLAGCGAPSSTITPSPVVSPSEATIDTGALSPTNTPSVGNNFDYRQAWAVAFSPDGQAVAAGYAGLAFDEPEENVNVVRLWNLNSPNEAPTILKGHTGYIESLAISPDGQYLAAGGNDSMVLVWRLNQPTTNPVKLSVAHSASDVAFSPNSRYLASGGAEDETVSIWDMHDPQAAPKLLRGDDYSGQAIAFSPDGKTLVVGEQRGVRIWGGSDFQTQLATLRSLDGAPIWAVAFSPEGQMLAEGGVGGTIRLWDMHDPSKPSQLDKLTGHTNTVHGLEFTPDGGTLVSGSGDKTVLLWDMNNLNMRRTKLISKIGTVDDISISPDGRRLAVVWGDPNVWIWKLDELNATPITLMP